jgi:hypothetical protein
MIAQRNAKGNRQVGRRNRQDLAEVLQHLASISDLELAGDTEQVET